MKASPVSESLYPIYKNLQNFALIQTSQKLSQKCFILEKFLYENEPNEPQNLKKMLRKSPAPNDRAAIFKNADFK